MAPNEKIKKMRADYTEAKAAGKTREREHVFLARMSKQLEHKPDSGHQFIDDDDAVRLLDIAQRYRRMDREAAKEVELVICMRSLNFTGYAPYVGWKGLGLALNQDYDELARLREAAESE